MSRKIALTILLFCSFYISSQEDPQYSWKLNLDLSINPKIEDLDFHRGIALGISRKVVNELYISLNTRFINNQNNYLSLLLNYDIKAGKFIIPIFIGAGGSVYEIDLEDLNFYYEGKTGIEYSVADNFNYALSVVLISPIFYEVDLLLYIDLGIKYRF